MDSLLEILQLEELNDILEENPDIKNLSKEEIISKINYLKELGCNERDIIIENPFYLSRELLDIKKCINLLNQLKITNINLFIESYPNILNKDSYEIEEWIKNKNLTVEEAIDLLESYPNLLEEE